MAALESKMRMAEECDYRQLYLDCKKNVSLFMRQVDAELSAVLNAHEQEKNSLRAEIDRLKSQIAQQPASGRARTNSTCTQSTSSRHTGDSVGKLSLFDRNTLCSELYQSEPNSFIYSTNSPLSRLHSHKGNGKENGKEKQKEKQREKEKGKEKEKENRVLPENINSQGRDVRGKAGWERQRKALESGQKAENVKDFLKDMREKLKGERVGVKEEQPIISVITPGFFTVRHSES